MIKIICDRCGAEIEKDENIGHIAINFREVLHGDFLRNNPLEENHYCVSCMDKIWKFIMPEPQAEPAAALALESAEPVTEPAPEPEEAKKRVGGIDIGKIMALKNAGWKNVAIAEEMGMDPLAVGNAIYNYKKKKARQG